MTGGHECLVCHERVRPFGQGCACDLPDYDEPDPPSTWTPEPDIEALEREEEGRS